MLPSQCPRTIAEPPARLHAAGAMGCRNAALLRNWLLPGACHLLVLGISTEVRLQACRAQHYHGCDASSIISAAVEIRFSASLVMVETLCTDFMDG